MSDVEELVHEPHRREARRDEALGQVSFVEIHHRVPMLALTLEDDACSVVSAPKVIRYFLVADSVRLRGCVDRLEGRDTTTRTEHAIDLTGGSSLVVDVDQHRARD